MPALERAGVLYLLTVGVTLPLLVVSEVLELPWATGVYLGDPWALIIGILMIATSRATTPQRALSLFYKSIGRGRMRAAQTLVIPNDVDDFPREYPEDRSLGLGGMPPYSFDTRRGFAEYWKFLVRYPPLPYCIVRIRNVRVEKIAPDVAVVEFDLKLCINTSLWILLIFVALLIALIVDVATRRIAWDWHSTKKMANAALDRVRTFGLEPAPARGPEKRHG